MNREEQLIGDIIATFQEIDVRGRYGDFETQRLQYIVQRVTSTLTDALDDIYQAVTCESPIESMMYLRLCDFCRSRKIPNLKVEKQKSIGLYRVDFLVSSDETNVVVDCDGHDFHERTKDQVEHDKKRDRYLTALGYKILRYSGSELYNGRVNVSGDLQKLFFPERLGVVANGVD